jgi:tetratricopeptide (TPR) repeat protein
VPTLRRWIEREYKRLDAAGKTSLVEQFETFNQGYFEADYHTVLSLLPDLYKLADRHREPVWRLVATYYHIPAVIHWLGNLQRGLELVTGATVQAHRLLGDHSVLAIYIREMLLYAWLDTDGPGYAVDVLAAVAEIEQMELERDLARRFDLVRAQCLSAMGQGEEAFETITALLPDLNWPPPYHHSLRAGALAGINRLEEALSEYRKAHRGFQAINHAIECNEARLGIGETLLRLGRTQEGLGELRAALSNAQHGLNRAHIGRAQALIGRGLAQQGQYGKAVGWFAAGLEMLNELGWWRTEAEFAVERLKAMQDMGFAPNTETWIDGYHDAARRVERLPSTDLSESLAELEQGHSRPT